MGRQSLLHRSTSSRADTRRRRRDCLRAQRRCRPLSRSFLQISRTIQQHLRKPTHCLAGNSIPTLPRSDLCAHCAFARGHRARPAMGTRFSGSTAGCTGKAAGEKSRPHRSRNPQAELSPSISCNYHNRRRRHRNRAQFQMDDVQVGWNNCAQSILSGSADFVVPAESPNSRYPTCQSIWFTR